MNYHSKGPYLVASDDETEASQKPKMTGNSTRMFISDGDVNWDIPIPYCNCVLISRCQSGDGTGHINTPIMTTKSVKEQSVNSEMLNKTAPQFLQHQACWTMAISN
ncbi:hypothetical protein CHS0354_006205 [Potamilus streckersoni]|uniref:Uncharacterized protein n=1 Tax=Potamilus streckersoni TaxID=2493646 RepID=A0AAE0W0I8_9BIVA|nr:hypothetical protein CHS0354_006205 [Potamilus streckersoni]